ncbi:MAG: AMIN-like domain-containing (lipo)protein, partial [Gaiellaceae bacterium]
NSKSSATETTGPTTTSDGIDTLAGASTGPVDGQAQIQGTALLERVDLARHEGYDRVVFQFRNGLPGYRVAYAEAPLHEDGSGKPVPVAGNYFVVVRMEPASGFDLGTGDGKLVYTGPRRLAGSGAGTSEVSEIVRTGDFEAVLTWAVGLVDRVDFRVTTLSDPARLVVDFRNH